jgi:hypothetical protein
MRTGSLKVAGMGHLLSDAPGLLSVDPSHFGGVVLEVIIAVALVGGGGLDARVNPACAERRRRGVADATALCIT